jgi:transcriptional regulator with XRE-family HTH domain
VINNLDIGKKIRNLRQNMEMSQIELAKIIGVSKSTMSNYERNYSIPDPDIVVALANYFNVSVDYLYDLDNSPLHPNITKENTLYHTKNSLTKDELNVLAYYNRLSDEHKDYIKGQMIQLFLGHSK